MSIADKVREAVARLHARQSYLPDHRVRRAPESPFPTPPDAPEDASLRQSLASIADRQFCLGVKYSEQQLRADRTIAHPEIDDFGRLLVKRMRRLDVPMFVSTLFRGRDDQESAYVLGHSKAHWGQSAHNFGCAVDVIHGVKGWGLTRQEWSIIGHVGKELAAQRGLKVTWGGDWERPWDPAHWELTDWRALKDAP
jgi:hypothetical protein